MRLSSKVRAVLRRLAGSVHGACDSSSQGHKFKHFVGHGAYIINNNNNKKTPKKKKKPTTTTTKPTKTKVRAVLLGMGPLTCGVCINSGWLVSELSYSTLAGVKRVTNNEQEVMMSDSETRS